jgi:transcription termination factor NusB
VLKYDRGEKKKECEPWNEIRGREHKPAGTIVKKTPENSQQLSTKKKKKKKKKVWDSKRLENIEKKIIRF